MTVPKLANWSLQLKNDDGSRYHFKFPTAVNSTADKFTIKLTPKCCEFKELNDGDRMSECDREAACQKLIDYFKDSIGTMFLSSNYTFGVGKKTKYGKDLNEIHFTGPDFEELKDQVMTALKDYFSSSKVEDLVIVYSFNTKCEYYKGESGEITRHNNGAPGQWVTGENNSHWCKGSSATIELNAGVFRRTTVEGKESTSVTFTKPSEQDLSEFGQKLAEWSNVSGSDISRLHKSNRYKIIAYTEDSARFFYELLYSIHLIVDKMLTGLGGEAATQNLIEAYAAGAQPLLGAGGDDNV